ERIGEKIARKRTRPAIIDVKLTPGGIRDIEFLVQCLQRLHGARESSVRHRGTLLAIRRLEEHHLLSATEAERLAGAYQFLRRAEHALQFEDDRQTHALPTNPLELQFVANRILRSEDNTTAADQSALLLRELNQHLEDVQTVYERIVHAQRPLYYSYSAVAPEHEETSIPPFRAQPQAASGASLADFIEALPECGAERKLMAANSKLRSWVTQIFESAPLLAAQLKRQPELLLSLQAAIADPGRRYAFEGLAPPLNDVAGLQNLFRSEMFRIQCAGVCLPEPIFRTLDQTSALAEFVIARAYRVALDMSLTYARNHATPEKPFEEPQSEIMVVALGRLGMREFDVRSDADLLFIIPDEESRRHRFWTRVVERLLDVLSTYDGDGPTLSIDTRLRPNGREGMLVQTESKYVDYFSGKAEAWEGIAYMKARAVAGDTDRATRFLAELQQVDWRRYGQSGRSKHDLRQMRLRLQKEQGASAPLKAEYGGYYDADFILMFLRLRGAGMFFKSLNTPERIDVVEKMGHLERADAEFLLAASTHFRALDHAIRLVTGHAEGKLPAIPEQRETIASLLGRWTAKPAEAETLEADLLALQGKMHRLFERVFAE
ncbi:MAG TPA: glutamine-synthetase adenylyltransferase, partial [Bryobacteraceae bacterium]|nr:glutamine-synthetase adenylyltransferase [Bryobacteraceae bacterium]